MQKEYRELIEKCILFWQGTLSNKLLSLKLQIKRDEGIEALISIS